MKILVRQINSIVSSIINKFNLAVKTAILTDPSFTFYLMGQIFMKDSKTGEITKLNFSPLCEIGGIQEKDYSLDLKALEMIDPKLAEKTQKELENFLNVYGEYF